MSVTDSTLQPPATTAQQALRDPHLAHEAEQVGGWPLDRPFPALMTAADLMVVFGIGHSWFAHLRKLGRFRQFEVFPRITNAPRYSGEKVRDYVRGQGTAVFGRKRA
jgi:hypothetical protein